MVILSLKSNVVHVCNYNVYQHVDYETMSSCFVNPCPCWHVHTCEPVASKMLEKFTGELAKKRENFVGLRYVKNVGK